jgi:hypothetical protein
MVVLMGVGRRHVLDLVAVAQVVRHVRVLVIVQLRLVSVGFAHRATFLALLIN